MTFTGNIDKTDCFKGRRQTEWPRYTTHFIKIFQSHCILSKYNIKVVIIYFICISDQNVSEALTYSDAILIYDIWNKHFLFYYLQILQKIIMLSYTKHRQFHLKKCIWYKMRNMKHSSYQFLLDCFKNHYIFVDSKLCTKQKGFNTLILNNLIAAGTKLLAL